MRGIFISFLNYMLGMHSQAMETLTVSDTQESCRLGGKPLVSGTSRSAKSFCFITATLYFFSTHLWWRPQESVLHTPVWRYLKMTKFRFGNGPFLSPGLRQIEPTLENIFFLSPSGDNPFCRSMGIGGMTGRPGTFLCFPEFPEKEMYFRLISC